MRFVTLAAVLVLSTAAMLVAPKAQAACAGPEVSATISNDGALVVHGSGFGTRCYDANEPPAGEGELGPPARGITVVVRQSHVEFLVARGDAEADYTFQLEVTDPPPLAGDVRVEARFSNQDGFSSYLIATDEVTLLESHSLTAGTKVVNFADQATGEGESPAGDDASSGATAGAEAEASSGDLVRVVTGILAGVLLGGGGMMLWSRRQSSATRR